MFTLAIIDRQKDFGNKKGSLYVPGAEISERATVKFINRNHKNIKEVIFTVDWHTSKHCSFKMNGGIWPVHCVQFTEGGGISDKIINACLKHNLDIKILVKGNLNDVEEYGAFAYINKTGDGNYVLGNLYYENYEVGTFSDNNSVLLTTNEVVVCGLAGDYCVKESIKNLLKYDEIKVSVFKDGVSSIDDGTTFNNFIEENNLNVV